MDIILKFGEHYYESYDDSIWIQFVLTTFSAFLGFGFALLLYFLKNRSDKRKQNTKQIIESKNKLKYHELLIENLTRNTERQISSLKQFKLDQEKDLLDFTSPKQVVTNDFKRLIHINKDIFDSFNFFNPLDNSWIDYLKNLHTNIDFIEGAFDEISRISTDHLALCLRTEYDIKQKIELIPDRFLSFAFYLEKQLGEERWKSKLYLFVNKSIEKYDELIEKKADFNTYELNYLLPIIETTMQSFKEVTFLEEIILLAKNSRVKMDDIKTNVGNIIETFEEIQNDLVKTLSFIIEQNEKLKTYYNK